MKKLDAICLGNPMKKNDLFTTKGRKLTSRKITVVLHVINCSVETAANNLERTLNLYGDQKQPLIPFCRKLGRK